MAISDTTTLPLMADGHYTKQAISTIDATAPHEMTDGHYAKQSTGTIGAATSAALINCHSTNEANGTRDTTTQNAMEANERSDATSLVLTNGHSGYLDGEIAKPVKQEEIISAEDGLQKDINELHKEINELQKDINEVPASNGNSALAIASTEHQDASIVQKDDKSDVAAKNEVSQDRKSGTIATSEVPQDATIDRTPPPPKSSKELAEMVMKVLERYRMASRNGISQPYMAYTHFLTIIEERIKLGEIIHMVLPAFPFKSPNRVTKVLGALPDKAEEVALIHLEGLCRAVEDVYKGGCILEIVSDGISYSGKSGDFPQDTRKKSYLSC
jgi:Pyoverdine/dityrosine biosynthesis protein